MQNTEPTLTSRNSQELKTPYNPEQKPSIDNYIQLLLRTTGTTIEHHTPKTLERSHTMYLSSYPTNMEAWFDLSQVLERIQSLHRAGVIDSEKAETVITALQAAIQPEQPEDETASSFGNSAEST